MSFHFLNNQFYARYEKTTTTVENTLFENKLDHKKYIQTI
jgi:hypothetical protein